MALAQFARTGVLVAIIIAALSNSARGAPITFTLTFDDPGSTSVTLYDEITSNVLAAGSALGSHLNPPNPVNIELLFAIDPANIRVSAELQRVQVGTFDDGLRLFQAAPALEVATGIDRNGPAPDGIFRANPAHIAGGDFGTLWFDPDPLSRTAPVPPDRVDAVSTMLHELVHLFGFTSTRLPAGNGDLPPFGADVFDTLIQPSGADFFFVGELAQAAYGAPVPITFAPENARNFSQNFSHIGNFPPGPGSDLANDLMNGLEFRPGFRYEISALDVAILGDTGVPLVSQSGVTRVPQPESLLLFGSGVAALAGIACRRHRARRRGSHADLTHHAEATQIPI
jgi:hypothetical protein